MSSAAPTKTLLRTNTLPAGKGVLDWLKPFVTTSVGMKATTAVTGFLLTGFVIVHLIGNLQVLPVRRPGRDQRLRPVPQRPRARSSGSPAAGC